MAVVARFYCQSKTFYAADNGSVKLAAVCRGDHNKEWAAATPTGTFEMTINNPHALAAFEPGREYEITLVPVRVATPDDGHAFRQSTKGYQGTVCGECGTTAEAHVAADG